MSWFVTFFSAVLGAAAGGFGMCGIAMLCVRWYRISSFEGGSGYYVLFQIIFGVIGGFILATIGARIGHAMLGEAWYWQPACGVGGVAAILGLVLAGAYLMADHEPEEGDRGLVIAWEVRLPVENPEDPFAPKVPPGQWPEGELKLQVVNLRRGKVRGHREAEFDRAGFRQEGGQWILPATVPLFSSKGEFCVNLTTGGRDDGFWPGTPAKPTEHDYEWTSWRRTNKGMGKPSDEQAVMYRFRIVKP